MTHYAVIVNGTQRATLQAEEFTTWSKLAAQARKAVAKFLPEDANSRFQVDRKNKTIQFTVWKDPNPC